MKKMIFFIIATVTIIFVSSCTNNVDNGIVEYIPYQDTKDGQWSMISMDGKVLFSDEFKAEPTLVHDGRFFVKTKEGIWEMYSAESKPKQIGVDYVHTSGFYNGIALVTEKNKYVSIIDTDGNTKKVLDKINNKEIDGVRAFHNGYAVFMTTDSLWGAIDKNGNCVVNPEYYSLNDCFDGKFIGILAKYKQYVNKNKKDKIRISIIDKNGKQLFDISGDKYNNIRNGYTNGLLPVSIMKDNKEIWGLIDDKGKVVVNPSNKIKNIGTIHKDLFTYNNGEGWGLMNIKGEIIIRSKYEFLYYDINNRLIAVTKDGDSKICKYIDENDNQVGDITYSSVFPYSIFDNEHAVVKISDKIYSIIDKDGKQLENLPDIVNIGLNNGEDYIESDFVDFNAFIKGLNISENGVFNFNFNITPKDAVNMEVKEGFASYDDNHKAGSPYWYNYQDFVSFFKTVCGISVYTTIEFNGYLSRETYRTQRVIDYVFYDYYWYHDKHIHTGYVWNNVSVKTFKLSISNAGRMHGKLRTLFNVMLVKFRNIGKIIRQNNGAAIFKLNNEFHAVVYMEKNEVNILWGKLTNVNNIDISKFNNVVEEISEDANEIEVDTTEVDTTAIELY